MKGKAKHVIGRNTVKKTVEAFAFVKKISLALAFASILTLASTFAAWAQPAKPAAAPHPSAADATARKQLAVYMADFRSHPDDAELRDKIIDLAKSLKPAPAIPQAARADFTKAAAQLKTASTAADYKAVAGLFEQVAAQAPWYAGAYYNAASAYAKAAELDSAKRNLAFYLKAVRPGATGRRWATGAGRTRPGSRAGSGTGRGCASAMRPSERS